MGTAKKRALANKRFLMATPFEEECCSWCEHSTAATWREHPERVAKAGLGGGMSGNRVVRPVRGMSSLPMHAKKLGAILSYVNCTQSRATKSEFKIDVRAFRR
jgi:hypothetical protein